MNLVNLKHLKTEEDLEEVVLVVLPCAAEKQVVKVVLAPQVRITVVITAEAHTGLPNAQNPEQITRVVVAAKPVVNNQRVAKAVVKVRTMVEVKLKAAAAAKVENLLEVNLIGFH
jgi:2',3'-cyclic-nucleotide 2'-phosphodiesterase (5'-nucleotidase family)